MLLIFAAFLLENILSARNKVEDDDTPVATDKKTVVKQLILFALGTVGIVVGSNLLVDNGSILARLVGIPENVIGLTAIAIGTSLPELVTAITAIARKESSISVGNVIGANIIDTTLILPVCAMISGGSLPVAAQVLRLDLPVCLAVAGIAVIPTLITQKFRRWQGVAAMAVYLTYFVFLFVQG